jgi:hypothetical protein
VARGGATLPLEERFYFPGPYRSWHGGPSAGNGRVPLILADPTRSREEVKRLVDDVLAGGAGLERFTDLVLAPRISGGP